MQAQRLRARAATLVGGAFLAAILIVTPSAQAAVTASNISAPADLTYLVYDDDSPNTFAIAGTTTGGTTGDFVDIMCYAGDHTHTVASNVPVQANGSFSVSAADLGAANLYRVCNLKAVPAGTTPDPLTPFVGPQMLVGYNETNHESSGPNSGKLYDYYSYFQQKAGGMDYDSLGSCGIDDGYLLDSTNSLSSVTWWCNAYLWRGEASSATRSELRVDGANAYPPYIAHRINSQAASGYPTMTYSYGIDSKTGNAVIHETAPIVKCPDATYPPTSVTCATFVSAGVTDTRTITQDHDGHVAWITDVFRSTDGHAHTLDLLWENDNRFHGSTGATVLEYRFPGQSTYATHTSDTVSLPATAGTILIRMQGSADGATNTGRGAIVYDRAAQDARFTYNSAYYFLLHQTASIKASGSTTFRFAYVHDFEQSKVDSLAHLATLTFKGCTVPKVAGKMLAAAKSAITHANCLVGKVKLAWSTKVKKGAVISSAPKAGTHVAYKAKVALVVSKGKK